MRGLLHNKLGAAQWTVASYERELARNRELREFGWEPDGMAGEAEKLNEIKAILDKIECGLNSEGQDFCLNAIKSDFDTQLEKLQELVAELPGFLQKRMTSLKDDVSSEYRTAFAVSTSCVVIALTTISALLGMLWIWVFGPLRTLLRGSRKVADGDFDHRISIGSRDEMPSWPMR